MRRVAVRFRYRSGCFLTLLVLVASPLTAGPPFTTDDPQPVDFLHWEFYLSSVQHFGKSETDATLPHVEINFGALMNLQLHLITPMSFAHANGSSMYGYGDTELGAKYRFVQESDVVPQVGTFPIMEVPTGNKDRGLGNGSVQLFLPLWLQKSWGKLTTYGGGGFWYNTDPQGRNWSLFGWEMQYDFSEVVTIGGELLYNTPNTRDGPSGAAFNIGGYINFDEHNHLLFSFGHSLHGEQATTGYLGYQVTI